MSAMRMDMIRMASRPAVMKMRTRMKRRRRRKRLNR
jgi:hypothetical protein